MARPTVLVVDSNESRRKDLTRGLAEFAYEVVGAATQTDGARFAAGLTPQMIVAEASLAGFKDASILTSIPVQEGQNPPSLVLLVEDESVEEDLPESVMVLSVAGLTAPAILRKLRVVLIAQEVGLEPDNRLESLIGDLHLTSLYELLPQLQKVTLTGRLVLTEGQIVLESGQVIAAQIGGTRGKKAFARLGRVGAGTFRILLGPAGAEREISEDLLTLMAQAIEDQHRFEELLPQLPDWESLVKLDLGPAFFATHFTQAQQAVLQEVQGSHTLRHLVDAVGLMDGALLEELTRLRELSFLKFEEPEIRVRIVTDSTADLTAELARRHRVHVVPLSVIFGEEIHKDGVDITSGGFYRMLATRKNVHPRTSPPTKGEFLTAYRSLVDKSDLVSIHISEKMSQTVVHAAAAAKEGKKEFGGLRADGTPVVEVVDGMQVSSGLGMLVLFAARMAERGLPATEIKRRIEEMRTRFHLLFVVDTLEFLARGGRIGKARALLGSLLGIKPILGVVAGEVAPVDKVRGGRAAHPKLIELLRKRVDAEQPVVVGLGNAAAPVWADRLRALVQQNFKVIEFIQSEIGPVVGTHAGPGTIGAVMFQPTEEETPLIAPLPAGD